MISQNREQRTKEWKIADRRNGGGEGGREGGGRRGMNKYEKETWWIISKWKL